MNKEQALELVRKVAKEWNARGFESERAWTDIAVEAVMLAANSQPKS
jgi:CDP-diacylglycerol pyrophosphatase